MAKVEKGVVKKKIPDISDWDVFLLRAYATCVKTDGLSVVDLKAFFEIKNIYDCVLLSETIEILSRANNYLVE